MFPRLRRSRKYLRLDAQLHVRARSGRTHGAGQTDRRVHTDQVPCACVFSAAIKMADYALAVQSWNYSMERFPIKPLEI